MQSGPVRLRAIERGDVAELHEWASAHDTWPDRHGDPYVPKTLAMAVEAFERGDAWWRPTETTVPFAVEAEARLVGSVALWGIDLHHRHAHLGIGLGPEHRGRGYGTAACRALLSYAFVDRGLHRVQLEVNADNTAGIRAYESAGFVVEGVLRQNSWARGGFVDEVVMSVLAPETR